MGIIFRVWQNIEEHLLEKYFAEIEFENEAKTFRALMPFIILAKNHDEAQQVIGRMSDALRDTYKFTMFKIIVYDELLIPEQYDKKIHEIRIKLETESKDKIGTIKFESRIGTKTKPNLPFPNHGDYIENIKERNEIFIDFPIIKNGTSKNPIYQPDEFFAIVDLLEEI